MKKMLAALLLAFAPALLAQERRPGQPSAAPTPGSKETEAPEKTERAAAKETPRDNLSVSELLELERPNPRSARDWRLPGARREEATYDRGLGTGVRQDRLRLRTSLGDQGRQPERDVHAGVANHGEVPIHQDRRPIGTEADVVAANIQVQEIGTVDLAGIRGLDQGRQRGIQPRGGGQARSEQRGWVIADEVPSSFEKSGALGRHQP